MWNDTDTPLAYLITFRTYGTWLHGDQRGSTNRFRNKYGTRFLPPEEAWLRTNTGRLLRDPVYLRPAQRKCVEAAIRNVCTKRIWALEAMSVRTNHVHAVTGIGTTKSSIALNAFKANATRELRAAGLWTSHMTPWADKGSRRALWNEQSVLNAIEYVKYHQGDELPDW